MSRELELLAKKHKAWVGYLVNQGCSEDYAEDIVHDAYVRMYDYLQKGVNIDYGEDDVNEYYFYLTLGSIYKNYKRINDRETDFLILDDGSDYSNTISNIDYDPNHEEAYNILIKNIFREVNHWGSDHQAMFRAYFTSGLSLDKLAKETGVGRASLYNSIRKYREVIYDIFYEDVQDFYNKDYNQIKIRK